MTQVSIYGDPPGRWLTATVASPWLSTRQASAVDRHEPDEMSDAIADPAGNAKEWSGYPHR